MAPKVSESVEQLRAAGNQNFRNGQYGEASALYERALRLLQARGRNPPRVSPPGLRPPPASPAPVSCQLSLRAFLSSSPTATGLDPGPLQGLIQRFLPSLAA